MKKETKELIREVEENIEELKREAKILYCRDITT